MTVEQQPSTTRTETEDLNNAALLQHKYNLTKSKSKEEEVGGPTLLEVLELQRSSAVVSRSGTKGGHSARGDGSNNISGGSDDGSQPPLRLAWLSRYDQRIIDLIFWKSKTKSFFTFSWIITILVVLRTHSAAYVLSAALMSLMIVMMLFVGGSTVLQAATLHTAKHPFASTLSGDITLPESMQSTISDVLLSLINGSLDFVGRIVLVQSFSLTLRAITLLWIIWAHMDDIYLLFIIMTCALFFIPKFYQEHTDTCESVIEVYEENSLTGVISAQFETLEAEQDAANKNPLNGNLVTNSKEVLTASITGILIVLLVKYFLANDQGEIPHLFTYIWSLYQSAVKSSQ